MAFEYRVKEVKVPLQSGEIKSVFYPQWKETTYNMTGWLWWKKIEVDFCWSGFYIDKAGSVIRKLKYWRLTYNENQKDIYYDSFRDAKSIFALIEIQNTEYLNNKAIELTNNIEDGAKNVSIHPVKLDK